MTFTERDPQFAITCASCRRWEHENCALVITIPPNAAHLPAGDYRCDCDCQHRGERAIVVDGIVA